MSRIRWIVVGLLAAVAASGIASASASAACSKEGGDEGPTYCVAGEELGPGESRKMSDLTMVGSAKLETTIAGNDVTIECPTIAVNHEKVTIEGPAVDSGAGKSKGEIEFTGCKLFKDEPVSEELTKCKVANIHFKFNDELAEEEARLGDEFWGPTGSKTKENEEIVTISITGAECALKGNFKVKGSKWCSADGTNAQAETEKETHEVVCKKNVGDELTFGAEEAFFTALFVLEGPESDINWSITAS